MVNSSPYNWIEIPPLHICNLSGVPKHDNRCFMKHMLSKWRQNTRLNRLSVPVLLSGHRNLWHENFQLDSHLDRTDPKVCLGISWANALIFQLGPQSVINLSPWQNLNRSELTISMIGGWKEKKTCLRNGLAAIWSEHSWGSPPWCLERVKQVKSWVAWVAGGGGMAWK